MYFCWMANTFDVRHTQTSDSIRTSLVVLHDPENKHVYSSWNFVAIMYTSWNIRNFSYTSG